MATQTDDRKLMARYRDGDAAAFEELYGRHRKPLYRYLLRRCGHAPLAEEIFQEVWLKVIRSRERYRPAAKFSTWLYRLARNCLIDHLRQRSRNPVDAVAAVAPDALGSARDNPESAATAAQTGGRLAAAIAALPPDQRDAFLLRQEGGFSLEEIAQLTGTGRETVKSRLRYALRKLRAALEDRTT